MLQLDCLITFAIGSSLATAAGDALKATQYHTQNKYFIFTLLHINLVVVPLNIYMLWEHTGFETMFYYDATLHGIWPTLSMVACNLSAIFGFMLARKLVRLNEELTAYTVWTSAYTIALAVVSCHYDRFLYPGGIREFYQGKTYQMTEFLQSELCVMLVVSLVLLASPVFYAQVFWPGAEGYMTKTRKYAIRKHTLYSYIRQGAVAISLFSISKLANLTPTNWGWDRPLAIAIGQLAGLVLLVPVFLISTRYTVTRRIDIRRSKQQSSSLPSRRQNPSRLQHQMPIAERELEDGPNVEESHQEDKINNGTNGHLHPVKQE